MSNAVAGLAFPATARLLAIGLAPPDDEGLGRLQSLANGLAQEELAPQVAEAVEVLLRALDEPVAADNLAAEYEMLFGVDCACPPYEGSWELDPFREARQQADVAGFYGAFGAVAGGAVAERVDHAACELEFLSFLGLRRLEAEVDNPEEADVCRQAEDDFLREHVARFLPQLSAEVAAVTVAPLYIALALLGTAFVEAEVAARNLEVRPVAARRPRTVVDDDRIECGAGCAPAGPEALLQLQPTRSASTDA